MFLMPIIPCKCSLEEHSGYLCPSGHKEPSIISKSPCKIISGSASQLTFPLLMFLLKSEYICKIEWYVLPSNLLERGRFKASAGKRYKRHGGRTSCPLRVMNQGRWSLNHLSDHQRASCHWEEQDGQENSLISSFHFLLFLSSLFYFLVLCSPAT